MRRWFPSSCCWLLIASMVIAETTRAAEHAEKAALPATTATSLLENGGMEDWRPLRPEVAQQEQIKNVRLIPDGLAPAGWTPHREISKNHELTGTVALDERVYHSGHRSVRLENRDMRDITCLQYSTEPYAARPEDVRNVRPGRRYALRWWVKGQEVDSRGTGAILMMYTLSFEDGKSYRKFASEEHPLPTGTFDWQQRELILITDPHVRWAVFNLQLRWTTGTVWYDDVELIDMGPVVHVETY